jgi:hypothetical protein
MFSATAANVVPASTLPRFWWVSDWFCAIQFAQDWAYPLSALLAQSPPMPAVPRSVFMASMTALPPPSHAGAGAGGGGATVTGVGSGAGAGGAVVGGVVVGVVVDVVVVLVVEVVVDVDVVDRRSVVATLRSAESTDEASSRPSNTSAEAEIATTAAATSAPMITRRVPNRPTEVGSAPSAARLRAGGADQAR